HAGGGNAHDEQPRGWTGERIIPESDEPHRVPRAPQFFGEGARFGAMDPGERVPVPGFAKDGDVQGRPPGGNGFPPYGLRPCRWQTLFFRKTSPCLISTSSNMRAAISCAAISRNCSR